MIVFTTKLTKRKIAIGIIVACIMICSVIAVMGGGDPNTIAVLENGRTSLVNTKLKTNEDRVTLLESFGWSVDEEPMETLEVRIPEKFDGVYNEYNEIQKKQGLNLTEYAGKRVTRYTYRINNHPSGEAGTIANVIVYKNKLIAGDVCSPRLGGFMHGLSGKAENTSVEDDVEEELPKTETEQN